MKATPEHITRARENHLRALESLRSPACKLSGLQIWRKLCKLERIAHGGADAFCNGSRLLVGSSVFDFREGGDEWEAFCLTVTAKIKMIFGAVPGGFFVNGDARGCALKIDAGRSAGETPRELPEGAWTDWAGDMILAAVIN